MKRMCARSLSRRHFLGASGAAFALPALSRAVASPSVAVVRCSAYQDFPRQLGVALDRIGGIGPLVKGKTVAVKLNLTGPVDEFPMSADMPFRTDARTVAALVHHLAREGAVRVRLIESFFPASQDMALWARYGLDVNAINNLGVPVEWENVQNLGRYKQYVRLKVPNGGYAYPAYYLNPAFTQCDTYISFAKLKDHAVNGVTLSGKNNFGNTPCSLYGGDCGPNGNEHPTEVRAAVLHSGEVEAPSGVDAELHPGSPRDPFYRVPRVTADQMAIRPIDLAIIDGIETVRGGEGPWISGLKKVTPGVLIVGRNSVSTDAVAMKEMGLNPASGRGSLHLQLAQGAGLGTTDLSRIDVVRA